MDGLMRQIGQIIDGLINWINGWIRQITQTDKWVDGLDVLDRWLNGLLDQIDSMDGSTDGSVRQIRLDRWKNGWFYQIDYIDG